MTTSDIVDEGRQRRRVHAGLRCHQRGRTTSCSRTTRPTGTSSGGWPSASGSSSSSRTSRPLPQARRRRSHPARVAEDAALVQSARDGDPAGPAGHARDAGPEDQAGDLRHRRQREPDREDRRRPRHRRRVRSPTPISTSLPSRSRASPRAPTWPRRCSTSWRTATSPPRACATATLTSRPGSRSRSAASATSTAAPIGSPPSRTSFGVAPPTRRCFANSPAHTLLGSVGGERGSSVASFGAQLVLGIVTNNDDPDGLGRVRVKYPALGDDVEGTWARIASVSAGNARGLDDAAGRRRGGADRLRARRHHPAVRARLAVQRRRRAGGRSDARARTARSPCSATRRSSPRPRRT